MTISRLSSWFSYLVSSPNSLPKGLGIALTIIHLLPSSNSSLGGFFANVAGLALTSGAVLALSGTTPLPRSSGFLCVIWDGSTFFKPEVTDPPRLRSASRAPAPPAALGGPDTEPEEGAELRSAGGGGGGGGGPDGAALEDPEELEAGIEEGAGLPCGV